jgi:hypothetical protein
MNRFLISVALLLSVAGCMRASNQALPESALPVADATSDIAAFSANPAGSALPQRWEPMIIHRNKKRTEYRLVSEQGKKVLHARAAAASSGLMQKVDIDPYEQSWLSWQWRIGGLVDAANNFEGATEDAPARIILGFDGDKDTLPFADQILFETARVITGHDFPYATLMYIWGRKAPVDTIIASTRSSRVKMIVAASGPDGVGLWHHFKRDIVADFEKAFGEKPGRLIGVGVLTDTDNTGETVEAWYGDVRLQRGPQ